MLLMVIEHFKHRDARAVYRRFRTQGRMAADIRRSAHAGGAGGEMLA